MVKKRKGYEVIILEPALKRLKRDVCPSCGKPKKYWDKKRRKYWRCCSVKCTDKFTKMYIIYGWQDIRKKSFKRDNYACVKCGKQPKKRIYISEHTSKESIDYYKTIENFLKIEGQWAYFDEPDDSQLVGDHIKPIALGGKEFDIDNVQTLCIPCDKIKTKEDQKEIAKLRAIEKKLVKDQKQLTLS